MGNEQTDDIYFVDFSKKKKKKKKLKVVSIVCLNEEQKVCFLFLFINKILMINLIIDDIKVITLIHK